jgi:hypothetical protein
MKANGVELGRTRRINDAAHTSSSNRVRQGLRSRRNSDAGATLILALVFIVSISLIVGALANWVMDDLHNTTVFSNLSAKDYAVSGTMEVAIQSIRYQPLLPLPPNPPPTQKIWTTPGPCWTPGAVSELTGVNAINGIPVVVWCSTYPNFNTAQTRTVTFYACEENASNNLTYAQCFSNPTLEAIVAFDDYPGAGGNYSTTTCLGGTSYCGFSATTEKWTWG